MSKIAFLGLGAMGSRMAVRLAVAGHDVSAWNRSSRQHDTLTAAGASIAATPAVAVADADVVMSMVRDDEASRSIWTGDGGALQAMLPQTLAVECSTLSPTWIRELSSVAGKRGVGFLEAPVVGSRPQAENGELIFLVGGPVEHIAVAQPLLDAMGGAVHHAGPYGSGAAAKLAVNAMLAVQAAWLGETIGMLRQAGQDVGSVLGAALKTPVFGPAAQGLAASIQSRSFAPLFPVELAEKDLAYALASASAAMPLTEAARAVFAAALEAGHGAEHITAVSRLFDSRERD